MQKRKTMIIVALFTLFTVWATTLVFADCPEDDGGCSCEATCGGAPCTAESDCGNTAKYCKCLKPDTGCNCCDCEGSSSCDGGCAGGAYNCTCGTSV